MTIPRRKYGNRKCEFEGITFDSRKERDRWIFLRDAQNRGEIEDLERQVTYELIPKITERVTVHLKTKDKEVDRFVQRPVTYTADFRYRFQGETVVEDVKASPKMLPPEYILREKLFRWKYGFKIRRIFSPGEPAGRQKGD